MSAQLITYIVLSILVYHAFRILKFINTSPLQECAFVLKNVELLKTLPLDFTNIMCLSTIDKYVKRNNFLFNISLIEFVVDCDTMDDTKKTKKNIYYIMFIIMSIVTLEEMLSILPFFLRLLCD
jgi:hypothetical protein